MKKFEVTGIDYDFGGDKVVNKPPTTMMMACESEDNVVDEISNRTGWCVNGVESIREVIAFEVEMYNAVLPTERRKVTVDAADDDDAKRIVRGSPVWSGWNVWNVRQVR